jgi:hypothetical protein
MPALTVKRILALALLAAAAGLAAASAGRADSIARNETPTSRPTRHSG